MSHPPKPTESHAYGKVILLGEHAVVYGRPALAAGLPNGATASCRPSASTRLVIPNLDVDVGLGGDDTLSRALGALLETYPQPVPPLVITASTDLPVRAGLGSSAALGVAIARTIDRFMGLDSTPAEVAERALPWEQIFHGRPSGLDTTLAALGGLQFFCRGEAPQPVRLGAPLTLVVGHSGTSPPTRTMVEQVSRQHQRNPARLEKSFDAIGALVANGRLAAEAGDRRALGQLMDLNQNLLAGLLVSTAELEALCRAAREAGAYGAKLTGGGGGGCMIALVPEARQAAVKSAVEQLATRTLVVSLNPAPTLPPEHHPAEKHEPAQEHEPAEQHEPGPKA